MRSDIGRFYDEEVERRHRGEKKEKPKPKPFTDDICECGRRARLCSSGKCVTCHTKFIREEKAAARRKAY